MENERRRKGSVGGVIFILLLIAAVWFIVDGNTRLVTTVYTVESEKIPAEFDGFRIVQLSDLHAATFGKDNRKLFDAVADAKPDMIAITGDMTDGVEQDGYVRDMAEKLTSIAPTFYVTGNHEWGSATARENFRIFSETEVTVLRSTYRTVERGGAAIVVAGIDDPNGLRDQKTLPEVMDDIRHSCGGRFTVLLAHRNNVEYYNDQGLDLVLTGHAHGGLIRLPGTDGLIDSSRNFFPSNTSGKVALSDGGVMVVSRGIGNTAPTFRVLNNPEIVVVELKAK